MPELNWVYDVAPWIAMLTIGTLFAVTNLVSYGLIAPLRRFILGPGQDNNGLLGNTLAFYSVLYGLLVGTLAVVAYQELSSAQSITGNEAAALSALYRDAESYPEPKRTELTADLKAYTRYVIDVDWPMQQHGRVNKGGIPLIDAFQSKLVAFEPQSMGQQIVHAEALRQFNNLTIQRRARMTSIDSGMPGVLWCTLIGGSLTCLFLMWLYDGSRRSVAVLSSITAFSMGCMIGLIALMDNPFRGQLAGGADAYIAAYDTLMQR